MKSFGWNYRIFKDKDGDLSVRETYYDDEGKVNGWSQHWVIAAAETIQDLLDNLETIKKDIIKSQKDIIEDK